MRLYSIITIIMLFQAAAFTTSCNQTDLNGKLNEYAVTYDSNGASGGSVPAGTEYYLDGETVTVEGNTLLLTKTNYSFSGWNTLADGTGTTYTAGQEFLMTPEDIVLYAFWTAAVTYNRNQADGGTVPVDNNDYVVPDTATVLGNTGTLVKTGCTFDGWNTLPDGSGTGYAAGSSLPVTGGNVVLYARWLNNVYNTGDVLTFTADGVSMNIIYITGKAFKTGTDDSGSGTVADDFWISETEVTYELWKKVYDWATDPARGAAIYNFANPGSIGSSGSGSVQQPVTMINWRDSMVWCNAYTEWYNAMNSRYFTCVYRTGVTPIRDSRDSNAAVCDSAVPDTAASGFRLPASGEWELAARYVDDADSDGDISDPGEFYPGNYASGAATYYNDTSDANPANGIVDNRDADDAVSVYSWFWDGLLWSATGITGTLTVKSRGTGAAGLYDMSGNVKEWCFDVHPLNTPDRVLRGGGWNSQSSDLQVGLQGSLLPGNESIDAGFRIARSAP